MWLFTVSKEETNFGSNCQTNISEKPQKDPVYIKMHEKEDVSMEENWLGLGEKHFP